ncbi:peptidase S28 [Coniochaeta sp. 2T2.1]|nr:peptidase S28 [Coniochaeta sp. 2T2.1]
MVSVSVKSLALAVLSLQVHSGQATQQFRTSLTLPDFHVDPTTLYPAYNLSVPIDHFHNDSLYEPHSDGFFNLRYWFDASHYKPGGPVIVLQSGETSGEGRLPFLQKGIVAQLSQATNGLGVILEHRYYGTSFPVPDLSTENMRFLTTDQALADMAYFARNVVFEGLEHRNLTSYENAYIAYGGSYAGAFVAILRKQYPDVYWGAISSSGVTEAIYDYWQYYDAAKLYAPQDCVNATERLTNVVDNILIGKNGTDYPQKLKSAFGLGNLTRSDDFAYAISSGIAGLQSTNWDPAENSTDFGLYCNNVSSSDVLYPGFEELRSEVRDLIAAGGGYTDEVGFENQMLNYIGWINSTVVATCKKESQEACFTNYNSTFYEQDTLEDDWRSWPYQYCTQWGYLQTGSGVPADQLPLISRLIDLDFNSIVCREAFNITGPPDVDAINKYGGFQISYPRLAIIDGEKDPWRAATPHAIGQPDRPNTASEPFILIKDGVHHWDENGVFPNETTPEFPPQPVADTQKMEAMFVQEWMMEWQLHCMVDGNCAESK